MAENSCVVSINISRGGVPKLQVNDVDIREQGLKGDGHNHEKHYRLSQAVCIQDIERLDELKAKGYPLTPGSTGENLTVRGLNVNSLSIGTVLIFFRWCCIRNYPSASNMLCYGSNPS